RYDAIMLENVSAGDFGENRLRLLRDYVNEFGGGLLLVGGRNSFKAGGYAGTALEEASPLAMDISADQRPSTSVILAMDDSRSMWLHGTANMTFRKEIFGTGKKAFHGISTHDKAQFMKDVFKRVVLGLTARDRIGAVGMSSELLPARWYIRPQRVTDKDRLVKELDGAFRRRTYSILYPTLDEARFNLFNDAATYKQVLLLTDGFVASDSNYRKFAMMLLSDGVSLSTVGVGGDSNVRLLEEMARWGGGQFYLSKDLKNLGDVYEKELNAPTKQLLVERPVPVAQINESPLTKGLDMNLAPVLFGYVRTRPKASSNLVLAVEGTSDPLLASWSYGAGKVVAFTSSAVSSWATLWVKDWEDGYSRFWRQQVQGVLREPGEEVYRVHLKSDGLRLKVSADVIDSNENFINGTQVEAKLFYLGERGDVFSSAVFEPGDLLQSGPGRYEHEFTPERKGVYLVSVRGKSGRAGNVETTGTIINISKEHLNPGPDSELLAAVAQVTKGKVTATTVEALGVEALKERRRHDLGYYTTLLAALLLAIEVVIRRWPAIAAWFARTQSRRAVA
ncbi:MAG: glutamine amidotransferase, partial [Planctomycetota bacterium]|nr:glutamine amidotransferase [Planctomycetota bacterium]